MHEPQPSPPLLPLKSLLPVFSAVLAIAAYIPALGGPFVWDDQILLTREEVTQLQPLHSYFARPFWLSTKWEGGSSYYRPASILSLALDRALHGDNPTGFHLTNLFLHGGAAALVCLLAQRLGARPVAALLGALLFAWFPRLTEAAAWTSGRTDLLASVFSLGALLVTLSSRRGKSVVASVLIFLGLLSKEVALAPAVALLGYEYLQSAGQRLSQRTVALVPTGIALVTYLSLRTRVLGGSLDGGDLGVGQRLLAVLESIGRYGTMLLDGWHPRLNIGFLGQTEPLFVAVGVLLLILLLLAPFRLRVRREEGLLLATAALALGLVLHILPVHSSVIVADRFLYLPLAGLVPVLTTRISVLPSVKMKQWWFVAGSLLALSYLVATWNRAKVWGDEIEFWGTAVREQTHHYNALSHQGLSTVLAAHGMWDEATTVLSRVQNGDLRNFALARYNQAQLLALNGETDQALALLNEVARLHPTPRLYASIALQQTVAGRPQEARRAMAVYASMIHDAAAVEDLHRQVALASAPEPTVDGQPHSLVARIDRARWLATKRLFRVAMAEFMKLLDEPAIDQENLQAILTFAFAYGSPAEVAAIYRRLLSIAPSPPEEFGLIVEAREREAERLRSLCRELRIPVVN